MLNVEVGYPGANTELSEKGIRTNRGIRLSNDPRFLERCIKKAGKNLDDTLKILKWNEENQIRFFRLSSEMFPHISNYQCLKGQSVIDYKELFYDIKLFSQKIKDIGDYANKHGHRLTFHPLPQTVINTPKHFTFICSMRDLWWHTMFLEIAGLKSSTITMHLGGVYGDKKASMQQFIKRYAEMEKKISQYIIIENDEFEYSINDIIYVSKQFEPRIPICFDYFHYICYNKYVNQNERKVGLMRNEKPQYSLKKVFKEVFLSWGKRKPKMHLSQQSKGDRIGSHSKLIKTIPKDLLPFLRNIDLMLETKNKEQSIFIIKKKYHL